MTLSAVSPLPHNLSCWQLLIQMVISLSGTCKNAVIVKSSHAKDSNSQLPQTKCEIYDRWQASPADIRSIRFTPDGRHLVSAGDDGKIIAWAITEDKKHDLNKKQIVATLCRRITSIDLVANEQRTLIASVGEDFQE